MGKPSDPLYLLNAFDRLTVGPVVVEKNRLTAPYTVQRRGTSTTTNFICKFEEPVFDPKDAQDRNLASIIAAQPALNYGLFCKEIRFVGTFDSRDQQFLTKMAENTAREIYVNKLLSPNQFLLDSVKNLPLIRGDLLRAALTFPGKGASEDWMPRQSSMNRHAVLSSGGKDSLLSFGLLCEIGKEPHPIFGNESGRHWYTALNAYRHFKDHVPNTARVWMNADRVFTFMLRQLPFIRQDFAEVRADIYPIRLWTVAVFLFSALPIMKKRGILRLIIGDEYDTTVRQTFRGISHYAGLYDQSRYFDNALTRYFHQKGFGISQFSILRPLSELMIQEILAARYPALQRLQVSCHAAHIRDNRVFPCGRCEKCTRIVSMLKARGRDPSQCGYTEAQIAHVLDALPKTDIHQESRCSEHVLHLLVKRGEIDPVSISKRKATPHPEVVKLRFDKNASPLNCIPEDLRELLYPIFLQHAEGSLFRDKHWIDFDPLSPESLSTPYSFQLKETKI